MDWSQLHQQQQQDQQAEEALSDTELGEEYRTTARQSPSSQATTVDLSQVTTEATITDGSDVSDPTGDDPSLSPVLTAAYESTLDRNRLDVHRSSKNTSAKQVDKRMSTMSLLSPTLPSASLSPPKASILHRKASSPVISLTTSSASAASYAPNSPALSHSSTSTRRRIFSSHRRTNSTTSMYSDEGTLSEVPTTKRLPGVGVIRDLIQVTAEKAADMDKEPRGSPRLNVFTTLPKNFTRFVTKVGPLAEFQEKVEKIIFWESPSGKFPMKSVEIPLIPSLQKPCSS